ncbi:hypothetical protein P7K49_024109 [Saguinus oedipus]|uniref:ASD2 domain-containing protein n=1 Tax=Saguinus oedipus TaxID=9490 RepID=A0ABQ9UNM0_SAGOE|nr:hypothetical protein P7K49_024109 [Saguinus oedipus]
MRFPESSVADRRRLFERDGKACSTLSLSGPDLKQFQQSALADYTQGKTDNLNSLREPRLQPRREAKLLLATVAETPQAPRDLSSSFAGGRRLVKRRRRELQVPRELLSEANGGTRGTQRVDENPQGATHLEGARAGKSMSTEDLLERMDSDIRREILPGVLGAQTGVPGSEVLHVSTSSVPRSSSSPATSDKCQDVLLGEDNGFEAESKPPSIMRMQPLLAGSLGGQPAPTRTQSLTHDPVNGTQSLEKKVSSDPQKSSEDIRTEDLAEEIVQDKSLADILDPDSRLKTMMELMEGLFPQDVNLLKENSVKRKAMQRTVSCSGCEGKRNEDKEAVGMLVNCPAYYSMSAPKAKLLNKIKEMPAKVNEE